MKFDCDTSGCAEVVEAIKNLTSSFVLSYEATAYQALFIEMVGSKDIYISPFSGRIM